MKNSSSIAYYISSAAAGKKAQDIKILNIGEVSTLTDYFVVCSGNSSVQVQAIADEIEDKMTEMGYEPRHKEGYASARWVLLDYGDVIAHVFYNEDREFYSLERLWADVQAINV